MSLFTGNTLMITGGTSSFSNAMLNRFLKTDIDEIRIVSRDAKKQDDMRHEFQAKMLIYSMRRRSNKSRPASSFQSRL